MLSKLITIIVQIAKLFCHIFHSCSITMSEVQLSGNLLSALIK